MDHFEFGRFVYWVRKRDVGIPQYTAFAINLQLLELEKPRLSCFWISVSNVFNLRGDIRYTTWYTPRSWSLFCQNTDSSVHSMPSTKTKRKVRLYCVLRKGRQGET